MQPCRDISEAETELRHKYYSVGTAADSRNLTNAAFNLRKTAMGTQLVTF